MLVKIHKVCLTVNSIGHIALNWVGVHIRSFIPYRLDIHIMVHQPFISNQKLLFNGSDVEILKNDCTCIHITMHLSEKTEMSNII